jgi:nucleoside-diphosphate-sugar epimerase
VSARIIGSGFIARNFKKEKITKDVIIFASGVSNSMTKKKFLFDREKKKLKKIIELFIKKKIIYFSTCSVLDYTRSKKPYQRHKIFMENYIKKNFSNYLIFRLPEVIGSNKSNKNTLINFLYERIKYKKKLVVSKNLYRNLIDIKDFIAISKYLINKNYNRRIINIASPQMTSVIRIVEVISTILNKKIILIKKNIPNNENFRINVNFIKKIFKKFSINFNNRYIYNSIKKYY